MIDTLLQNRYRLKAELGRGGMGVVYRAHDILLDRDVAIKVLSDPGLGAEGRARLLGEAQAAARLNHPNIISVYDAGEVEGVPYIVMELARGETLYHRRPAALDEIQAVALQICAALDHAHAHGIVHRDLKPENVVIAPDGTAKLMDFGLARSANASRLTREGAVLGTVFYLAPEQVTGQELDGRVDLYALGAMLYELTTGQLPFTGDDPLAIIGQHLHAPVLPPGQLRPDLPAHLESLILRLLAKDPAQRFASARDVAAALSDGTLPPLPAPARRHNLPLQLTSFVGREREIAEVQRLLAASRLVSLTGSGGCGKTRLALRVADDLVGEYPDGVWLVELASLSDPALVPQSVASLLGVREEPLHPLAKTLSDFLRPKTLLLILDNCEHLIEACAQLVELLLHACPNLRVLTSTREALGIPGETPFRVPPLDAPDLRQQPASPDDLMKYEAVRLFVDRARAVRPDFAVTDANAAAVAQICSRLDGVPLALELAAARIRAMGVDQIATRLNDRFRLLTGGSRTALPRQQTLRALIDWSWDLLSEGERALLRRLSVFADGWVLEAAEAVAAGPAPKGGGPQVASDDVLDLLTRLVDKSLVLAEERGGGTRYRLLETIRQYARDKLLESGESEPVRDQHLAYFVELGDKAEPGLRAGGQMDWLARLEAEHENVRAALKWARGAGNAEAGLRLSGALARFWYLRGYWNEGREWLAEMLAQDIGADASPAARAARARALYGAAWLQDERGPDIPLYEEGLALCRALGDRWGAAFCLRGLGAVMINQGEKDEAAAFLGESLALYRQLGDPWGIALVLFNLGWLAVNQDDIAQGRGHWQEGLSLFRQAGDRWGVAVTVGALGFAARSVGDYPLASELSKESYKRFRELGDKAGMALSITRLGNLAFRRGDYEQAIDLLERSLALQRDRGDHFGQVQPLELLGLVAHAQGAYERARQFLEQAVALNREMENTVDLAFDIGYLGMVAQACGQTDRALELLNESLELHRSEDVKSGVAFAHVGLGIVLQGQGRWPEARARLEEGLNLFHEVGDKRYIVIGLNALGRVAHALSDPPGALAHHQKALALSRDLGDKQGVIEALEGLAHVAAAQGQPDGAARLFGAAQALRERIGAPVPPAQQAEVEHGLAQARAALGESKFEAALAAGREMHHDQVIDLGLAPDLA